MPLTHMPSVSSRDRLYPNKQNGVKNFSHELQAKLETIYKPKLPYDVVREPKVQCPKWVKGIVNFFTKHPVK